VELVLDDAEKFQCLLGFKDRKFLFWRGMESPAAGSESTLPLMK
jgi:hypothetical protein